jgi:hypothetical protein
MNCGTEAACNPLNFQAWNPETVNGDQPRSQIASAQLASASIISNFDRALHISIAHLIYARLRN